VQKYLNTLEAEKKEAADWYWCAYAALLHLGFPGNDKSLQPLQDNELGMKNVSQTAERGGSQKEDPWFWTMG